jgi:branched-subunit amino acid ABC-type transport system permease component
VIIVLGGLESVSGAALGAVVLAILETFSISVPIPWYWHKWNFFYLPPSFQPVVPFALLVVVLVIMPNGLASLFNRKWKAA